MAYKKEKIEELVRELAGKFLQAESNRASLITVTRVEVPEKLRSATVYVSVFPEEREEQALDFLRRKRSDFRTYVKEHSSLMHIPHVDFQIDFGEKNRRRIEELGAGL